MVCLQKLVDTQLTVNQCVDQMSTDVSIKHWMTINRGHLLRISIDTQQWMFCSVYLFAIENYMNRSKKKKSNYLDSHGEEAQEKLAGL